MAVNYKKLWHILLDKDLYKKDLIELAGINEYSVKKCQEMKVLLQRFFAR